MVLHKQLKRRRRATITHYAPPALLRVVDSLCHNHAFYRVNLREFLANWATTAAPVVNPNLRFEDSFQVHDIHTKLNKRNMCDNILYGMTCGIFGGF